MSRFAVSVVFSGVDRMTAPVQRMQQTLARFTASVESRMVRIHRRVNSINQTLQQSGNTVAAYGAAGAAGLFKMLEVGTEFQKTIKTVHARQTLTTKQSAAESLKVYNDLKAAAMEVGQTTEFNATQSAVSLGKMAQAGVNAGQSISSLKNMVDFATAAEIGLDDASKVLLDTMGAFNLMSDDPLKFADNFKRASDVLVVTAQSTNATVLEIYESIRKAGATMGGAEIPLEEVSALLIMMGKAGVRTEVAGTALQNMLFNIVSLTDKELSILGSKGMKVWDKTADGVKHLLPLPKIIDGINKVTAKMSPTQKMGFLQTILGREGIAGMTKVVTDGGDKFRQYIELVRSAKDPTQALAGAIRDTAWGDFKTLLASIESVFISTFFKTEGPLRDALQNMVKSVRESEDSISSSLGRGVAFILNNIKAITIAAAGFIGLMITWASLTAVVNITSMSISAFTWLLANPVVAGVALAVAAIAALILNFKSITAYMAELPLWVDALVLSIAMMSGPVGWLAGLGYLIMRNWEGLQPFLETARGWFTDFFEFIMPHIETMRTGLTALLELYDKADRYMAEKESAVGKYFSDSAESISSSPAWMGGRRVMEMLAGIATGDMQRFAISSDPRAFRQSVMHEAGAFSGESISDIPVGNEGKPENYKVELVVRDETGKLTVGAVGNGVKVTKSGE